LLRAAPTAGCDGLNGLRVQNFVESDPYVQFLPVSGLTGPNGSYFSSSLEVLDLCLTFPYSEIVFHI
jgi:hypothetical protein